MTEAAPVSVPTPATSGSAALTIPLGSRTVVLSGPVIVAAWLVAIGMHVLALFLMYLYVVPFSAMGEADPRGRVEIALVGDPDGNATSGKLDGNTPPSPMDGEAANVLGDANMAGGFDWSIAPPVATPMQGIGAGNPTSPAGGGTGVITGPPGVGGLPSIGIGSGTGSGVGEGPGTGGGFFGIPGTVGSGGTVRGARQIVFVVDRSGSMADTFQHVKNELRRSIKALRQSQKFHVVFFASGAPLENPPGRCVSAISANKEEFFTFLDRITAGGGTYPEQAMYRALQLQPELIYMLTDGQFDAALLPKLREWNKDLKAKISTIAYVSNEGQPLLERIAREHNGEFRFVREEDLP